MGRLIEILDSLRQRGIVLTVAEGNLRSKGKRSAYTDDDRAAIDANREGLIQFLASRSLPTTNPVDAESARPSHNSDSSQAPNFRVTLNHLEDIRWEILSRSEYLDWPTFPIHDGHEVTNESEWRIWTGHARRTEEELHRILGAMRVACAAYTDDR